jgi:hypothetical protein
MGDIDNGFISGQLVCTIDGLYILIIFHPLNTHPDWVFHFPQVPACAEFYPMSPRFRVIDDTFLLSGLRHAVISDSATAF